MKDTCFDLKSIEKDLMATEEESKLECLMAQRLEQWLEGKDVTSMQTNSPRSKSNNDMLEFLSAIVIV